MVLSTDSESRKRQHTGHPTEQAMITHACATCKCTLYADNLTLKVETWEVELQHLALVSNICPASPSCCLDERPDFWIRAACIHRFKDGD